MAVKKESTNNRTRESERTWFDRTAAHWENQYAYPGLRGRVVQKRMSLTLEYLEDEQLPPLARVLDLGCGPGIVTERVASGGFRTYGVDFSGELLARAQDRLKRAGCAYTYLVQADVHRLPFKDEAFDAILCIALISWAADPTEALREIARVLRPGGVVIITVRNRFCIENVFDPFIWARRLVPHAVRAWVRAQIPRSSAKEEQGLSPKQFWICQFDRMLRRAGLEKVRWRTIQYGPFRLFRKPIFPVCLQVAIDRVFEWIWWLPIIRALGWTYCVKAMRPLEGKNARLGSAPTF